VHINVLSVELCWNTINTQIIRLIIHVEFILMIAKNGQLLKKKKYVGTVLIIMATVFTNLDIEYIAIVLNRHSNWGHRASC
jgi:hypothetical protein